MKILYNVALILIVLALLVCGYVSTEIKLVSVLYNHEDRMPAADFYPADSYRNKSLWPEPLGHLTNRGKDQHFKLGKYLRLQYSIILLACTVAAVQAAGLLGPAGLYGPPVAYPGYNNYPAQPAIASQQANVYRSPFNLGQVSTYSKAIDTPFSSVRKADIRVSNPGLALTPAYHGVAAPVLSHIAAPAKVATGVLGVAYSAAPAVSHMAYTNGLGYSYGW